MPSSPHIDDLLQPQNNTSEKAALIPTLPSIMDQHLMPILQSRLPISLSNPLTIHHVRDLIDRLEIKNNLTGLLCADLNFHHSCKLLNVINAVSYWLFTCAIIISSSIVIVVVIVVVWHMFSFVCL